MSTSCPNSPAITTAAATAAVSSAIERGVWSEEEHSKFLEALKTYPKGPWKNIALIVGTRSARQVQTHAQKYYEKVARHVRGLRKDRRRVLRSEHRLDDISLDFFKLEMSKDDSTPPSSGAGAPGGVGGGAADDWVTRLEIDDHLDWVEHLLQGGDRDSASSDSASSDCADILMDVDDTYLSYLAQVLDSHEL